MRKAGPSASMVIVSAVEVWSLIAGAPVSAIASTIASARPRSPLWFPDISAATKGAWSTPTCRSPIWSDLGDPCWLWSLGRSYRSRRRVPSAIGVRLADQPHEAVAAVRDDEIDAFLVPGGEVDPGRRDHRRVARQLIDGGAPSPGAVEVVLRGEAEQPRRCPDRGGQLHRHRADADDEVHGRQVRGQALEVVEEVDVLDLADAVRAAVRGFLGTDGVLDGPEVHPVDVEERLQLLHAQVHHPPG